MLVIRSGFLPRVLGVLLIVNGCAYVSLSLTSLLLPGYAGALGGRRSTSVRRTPSAPP
jgi:hypothetical protein